MSHGVGRITPPLIAVASPRRQDVAGPCGGSDLAWPNGGLDRRSSAQVAFNSHTALLTRDMDLEPGVARSVVAAIAAVG